MKRKILSLIIAFSTVLSSSVFVMADEPENEDELVLVETEGTEASEEANLSGSTEETVSTDVSEDAEAVTEPSGDTDISDGSIESVITDEEMDGSYENLVIDLSDEDVTSEPEDEEEELIERYVIIDVNDDIFETEEYTYVEYIDASEVSPSSNVYQTFEDAGPYLRQQFKNRADSIEFSVKIPEGNELDPYSIFYNVQEVLFEETGNPDEGDYFRNTDRFNSLYYEEIDGFYEIYIEYDYLTTYEQEQELSAEIDRVLDDLDLDGKSDLEKVYAIHKYITDNITYDHDHLYDDSYYLKYTAYAALMNKTAVCDGYAHLFYRMAREAGVETRYVSGDNHAWNFVVLDGTAYFLDSTWDAKSIYMQYEYFLVGTRSFFTDHKYYPEYEHLFSEYSFSVSDYYQPFGFDDVTDRMGDVFISYNSDGSVNFSTSDNSDSNIDGYYIDVYPSVNDGDHFEIKTDTLSYTLVGLIPGISYEISVEPYHYDMDMNEHTGKAQNIIVNIGGGLQRDINGIWFMESSGQPFYGWKKLDGKWYYFDPFLLTGWRIIDGKKYHLDEYTGAMDTGWIRNEHVTLFLEREWFYLGSDGSMRTGWQKINNKWYYFDVYSGVMQNGWYKISGKWYFFDSSGAMVNGWKQISGKWYYFDASGAMVNGWKKISGKWYYFEKSGAMKTGWLKYNGSWYYLDGNGAMVSSTTVRISGKNYKFNSSGICINP